MNSKSVLIILILPVLGSLWLLGFILAYVGEWIYNNSKQQTKKLIKELKEDF